MPHKISNRLAQVVDALPLKDGIRVLEVGCGTGIAALEIVNRVDNAYVLAVDRSPKAIAQARKNAQKEIEKGTLKFIRSKIEELEVPEEEGTFDFAFAIRVGALDGRHPEIEQEARKRIARLLKKNGKLFIDGGNPLKESGI